MALYLVRAKPKKELADLRKEMDSGKISKLRPFGETLQNSLDNARIDDKDGYALWVEEDYRSPPLAMERESVLERDFNDTKNIAWNRFEPPPIKTPQIVVLSLKSNF